MLPSVLGQLRDRGDLIVPVHHDTDAVALADGRAAQHAVILDICLHGPAPATRRDFLEHGFSFHPADLSLASGGLIIFPDGGC